MKTFVVAMSLLFFTSCHAQVKTVSNIEAPNGHYAIRVVEINEPAADPNMLEVSVVDKQSGEEKKVFYLEEHGERLRAAWRDDRTVQITCRSCPVADAVLLANRFEDISISWVR